MATARIVRVIVLIPFMAELAGCASAPVQPMAECVEGRFPPEIEAGVLERALIRATQWSNRQYGEECVLCADFLSQDDETFTIHITSPRVLPDMLINTSAEITVTKTDATLVDSKYFHSCYVKRVRTGVSGG
jgi:hypothetical protein